MKNKYIFSIYWAEDERKDKPRNINPFLIVDQDEEYFYGFFGVEREAKLDEVYHSQCLKVKGNDNSKRTIIVLKKIMRIKKKDLNKELFATLSEKQIQELFKKLSTSSELNNYPKNIKNQILTTYKKNSLYDIVHYRGEYYCLFEEIDKKTFRGYKVSKVPNKTSLMIEQDGIKMFIDCGTKYELKEPELLYISNLSDSGVYQIMVFLKNSPISSNEEEVPKTINKLWIGSLVVFNNKRGIILEHGYTHTQLLFDGTDSRFASGHIGYVRNDDDTQVHFEAIISSSKLQYILNNRKK